MNNEKLGTIWEYLNEIKEVASDASSVVGDDFDKIRGLTLQLGRILYDAELEIVALRQKFEVSK